MSLVKQSSPYFSACWKMTKIKDLSKCKHPNSRKTGAVLRQIKKEKSKKKSKKDANIKQNIIGEKLAWFRDNLEPNSTSYNAQQTLDLIDKYLQRFNEELEQIALKHSIGGRKNRQHASREDIINLTLKQELQEFNSGGLELPQLLNSEQFNLLKNWNGELRFLPKFKLHRYSKQFLEHQLQRATKSTLETMQ